LGVWAHARYINLKEKKIVLHWSKFQKVHFFSQRQSTTFIRTHFYRILNAIAQHNANMHLEAEISKTQPKLTIQTDGEEKGFHTKLNTSTILHISPTSRWW